MAKVECRLSDSVKADFQLTISQLGYKSVSEALRIMIERVTYNGECTPKEQFLSRQLLRLKESLVSQEDAQKLRDDFLEFLKRYNYLIYFARMPADDFYTEQELDDTDSLFYKQFYYMHEYSITPMEARQLIRYMYHDAEAQKEVREVMNELMAIKVKTADIQDLLSPADLAMIKEGGR